MFTRVVVVAVPVAVVVVVGPRNTKCADEERWLEASSLQAAHLATVPHRAIYQTANSPLHGTVEWPAQVRPLVATGRNLHGEPANRARLRADFPPVVVRRPHFVSPSLPRLTHSHPSARAGSSTPPSPRTNHHAPCLYDLTLIAIRCCSPTPVDFALARSVAATFLTVSRGE